MNEHTASFALRVRKDQCIGCGMCADACAYGAIRMTEYPEIDPYKCRLCGSCVQACPSEVLALNEPETQTQISGGTSKGIWVLAETEADGTLSAVTKELLGKAAVLAEKLHQDVEALLIGSESDAAVSSLAAYGAQRIHLAGHPSLASFIEENYARAAVQVIRECRPDILLVGATPRGRGLSARIAALLQTGLTADCTELDIDAETGLLQQIRPAFGGNLMATIATPAHRPQMASVRPGVMKAREANPALEGECIWHDLSDFKCDGRIRLLDEALETAGGDSLGNSRIVVGVGRGVKKKETVERICQWAKRLGAAVAGSRAAVEAGLIDAHLQVGQTGQTIAPDLYIAIGISGQIQHTAGIAGAKRIVAINPDKTAPIFNVADYGWAVPIEKALSQLMAVQV